MLCLFRLSMYCIFAYHNRNDNASMDQLEDLVFNQKMVQWGSGHEDGILAFDYILPRQAPVYNPYFLHFILCDMH
jgi:hypothetical protein